MAQPDFGERMAVVETRLAGVEAGVVRIEKKTDKMVDGVATKSDVHDLESRIEKLETRNGWKTTAVWVGLVTSMIVNVLLVYQMFGGK